MATPLRGEAMAPRSRFHPPGRRTVMTTPWLVLPLRHGRGSGPIVSARPHTVASLAPVAPVAVTLRGCRRPVGTGPTSLAQAMTTCCSGNHARRFAPGVPPGAASLAMLAAVAATLRGCRRPVGTGPTSLAQAMTT